MRGVFIIETWYNTVGRRHLVWAVAVLAMVGLSGCETFDFLSSEEPPLPGKRISIMTFNQRLESDPALAALEVRLPAPYVNAAWSQAGGAPTHAMYHLELTDQPRVAWRANIGDGSDDDQQLLAQPIVVDQRVYTMDSRSLVSAYDASSGRGCTRSWSCKPPTSDQALFRCTRHARA